MSCWSLFRSGVKAAIVAIVAIVTGMLMLLVEPGSAPAPVAAKSSTYTYQVEAIIDDTKVCVQPPEATNVHVFVRRYKDGKLAGRVPRIGVTVDVPHYGAMGPPSDFTNAFGSVGFTYVPLRAGDETLTFNAIGYDHGRPVQLSTSTMVQVVECSYRYTLSGEYETPEAPGMTYKAKLFGKGTVKIHDDGTLDGGGNVSVEQSMKFDVNTGAARVTFTGNSNSAPFTVKGKMIEGETPPRVLFYAPVFSVALRPMTYTATLQGHTIIKPIGGGTVDQNFLQLPGLDIDVAGDTVPIPFKRPPSTGSMLIIVEFVKP